MAEELSKSAQKRATKKLRDEKFAAENAAPPPAPEPKAKAKAKAEAKAAPAPAAEQPKAKAKGKAKAAPAPAPEPEPKAKAKGKAKAAPAPEPEPVKEAPKAKAKAAAEPKAQTAPKAEPKSQPKAQPKQKAAAKAKAAAKVEEEEVKKEELIQPFGIDDGSGGGWEQSTGVSKKAQKRQEKVAQAEAEAKANKGKPIPGQAPANAIPGMAPAVQRTSQAEINAVLQRAQAAGVSARTAVEAENAATSGLSSATVSVPENRIGVVIGPKGKNIQLIQEKTGVNRIDTSGEVFTITGDAKSVEHAERAIKELIAKGYWSESYENFKEEFVSVHPSSFPDLIGKGGVVIKAMKSEFGVEVTIPEVPKNPPPGKKYKVTLAGKNENVEACKNAINNIAMYGYDEITHPGFTHEELDVPDWAYRFLIGKAGSELRHIQNNYKVKVNIPREHSMCQSVVCVGEKINVERVKAYVEKLLWNAENQSKGRDKSDGATDGQDEEVEEDWMKAYMYKR